MAVSAKLELSATNDDRRTVRRTLRLESKAFIPGLATPALITNFSETGLLLSTEAELKVGDWLFVELVDGVAPAEVKWTSDQLFGCEFLMPISKAMVSSILLKSDAQQPEPLQFKDDGVSSLGTGRYGDEATYGNTAVVICVLIGLMAALVLFALALGQTPLFAEEQN